MQSLLLMLGVAVGYLLMYRLYGRFLSRHIFKLNFDAKVPAVEFEDGVDYVPSKKEVIFGHHFTSIAGTGPIVGPAVAVIWGWVPALVWVFVGSIVMGAVHDFGSLVISLRNQGRSISEYTAKYINRRTRYLFFAIVFIALWIVIAIFGLVVAIIFKMYPASVLPVWAEVFIAVLLGRAVYKRGQSLAIWSVGAVVVMYITVVLGVYLPFEMPVIFGIPATGSWSVILLVYAAIASILPVTSLLQPRDYINSHQLFIALGLLVAGIVATAFLGGGQLVAPAYQASPKGAPPIMPFLFITIACGAVSGFHSLVSSGTSSKQVSSEKDALFVGAGSMMMEGFLAVLVLICVASGIGMGYEHNGETLMGLQAWQTHYESWGAAKGLGSKLDAFVTGAARMIESTGVPFEWALAVMGVFVASFAGTTLDTATRIQRYVVSELFAPKVSWFKNSSFATLFAVGTAALLTFATGADGAGALALWPLFGAVNQALACLALLVITIYLKEKGGLRWLVSGVPAVFMTVVTLWATALNQLDFVHQSNWLLSVTNALILIIVVAIVFESVRKFIQLSK